MAVTNPDGASGTASEWERVLWRPQPFPDNYVPPTFLSALSKNRNLPRLCNCFHKLTKSPVFIANVLPYWYWPLVLNACTISQHISVIFVFLAVFVRLLDHTLDPRLLVALSTMNFVAGCVIWELLGYFWSEGSECGSSDRRTLYSPN
jgi:phosphatidylinositol N-acetylglucosaminyltransferase subunit C